MATKRQEFVTFYSPGTLFSEMSQKPIAERDVKLAVQMAETIRERYNARPYGFTFETRIVADDVPDGEGGELKVESKRVARSGTYFLGGKLETLDEVAERNDPKESILLGNMENDDSHIVCVTTNGYRSAHPFTEDDFVVNAVGEITERGDNPKHVSYREMISKRLKDRYKD